SFPFLPSLPISLLDSQTHWDPKADSRARAGLALDAAPTAGQLGTLAHRHEADVTGHADSLGDDESGADVADRHANSAVDGFHGNHQLCCARVLLDVVERFGDVLQDDRLDRGRNISRHADIDMRLDSGANPQRLETFADRLA